MGVVVVTGAAGALGSTVARHLVARGLAVAGVDRGSTHDGLKALGRELGAAFTPIALDEAAQDAFSVAQWERAVQEIEAGPGAPVGAVLAAGGFASGAPSEALWASMMQRNADSVHHAVTALLPGMLARKSGSIVVVGSRAAIRPETSAGAAAYAASKAAVVAFAQAVAARAIHSGVRVNAVLPSTIDTPANRHAMPDADFARWVPPASLADVIAFLLSDAARDVSGAALPVYGRA